VMFCLPPMSLKVMLPELLPLVTRCTGYGGPEAATSSSPPSCWVTITTDAPFSLPVLGEVSTLVPSGCSSSLTTSLRLNCSRPNLGAAAGSRTTCC